MILWMGVYPTPVLSRMEASVTRFVQQVEAKAAAQSITLTMEGGN
jgi:NADH:ubiquinone oxidoreductase subunit 4 (subunit M)